MNEKHSYYYCGLYPLLLNDSCYLTTTSWRGWPHAAKQLPTTYFCLLFFMMMYMCLFGSAFISQLTMPCKYANMQIR